MKNNSNNTFEQSMAQKVQRKVYKAINFGQGYFTFDNITESSSDDSSIEEEKQPGGDEQESNDNQSIPGEPVDSEYLNPINLEADEIILRK